MKAVGTGRSVRPVPGLRLTPFGSDTTYNGSVYIEEYGVPMRTLQTIGRLIQTTRPWRGFRMTAEISAGRAAAAQECVSWKAGWQERSAL